MIAGILDRLGKVESYLASLPVNEETRAVRRQLSLIAKQLAEAVALQEGTITVDATHERYAIEAVTAYLDGASRGDGYELLGGVLNSGCSDAEGSVEWMAGVVSALARLAGDVAVLLASVEAGNKTAEWEDALRIIQRFARRED
jgi:Tfp pilus assembly protein PilX